MELREYIRDVPDFPSPGILFRDITPLLHDPAAFRRAVDALTERFSDARFDVVAGIESRGFMFAGPMAYNLGVPLVPFRKRGKLPFDSLSVSYELEYGTDAMEVHVDAIGAGQRALIVDDLIATGGTLAAAVELVEKTGGAVAGIGAVIELLDLDGRSTLGAHRVESLLTY